MKWVGYFGWFLFTISVLYLNREQLKFAVGLFAMFFFLGFAQGPFLEPPSDSLDHIGRTHSFCGKKISELPIKNRGFWQYSMNSLIICTDSPTVVPESFLKKIDYLNGLYWGLAVTILFALSKSAGLPDRWSIFSVFCCFLFFGTNRFSYFSYYSLAASWTSMIIYWMWIAAFFFKHSFKNALFGIVFGVIALPILWVNHFQEAVFMGFILLVWLLLNLNKWVWALNGNGRNKLIAISTVKLIYVGLLIFLLFLLPQLNTFKNIVSDIFVADHWEYNSAKIIVTLGDMHLWGKVWGYRINDTLGLMGFLPIPLSIIAFCVPRRFYSVLYPYNGKMLVVGLLPFIYLFFPLFNYVWVSNAYYQVYYRICYSSIFWVTIAYFLFLSEGVFFSLVDKLTPLIRQKQHN
jgi:hypothetical protein